MKVGWHDGEPGTELMIGTDWRQAALTADIAFLLAFPSLFSIINPISGALIFQAVTRDFRSRGSGQTRRAATA